MNQQLPPQKIQYQCNICYSQPGMFLITCACFYCKTCFKEIYEKPECKVCKKPFDLKKTLDLTKPETQKHVDFLYDSVENQLKRLIETYKFQNLQQRKNIKYLEEQRNIDKQEKQNLIKRIESLENQLKTYSTNSSNKYQKCSPGKLNDSNKSNENHSNNFIDLKSIKHIVPKRNNSMTMTNSSNKNSANYSNLKVENLNVKTAENMKNPYIIPLKTNESFCTPKPSVLGNYYQQEGNNCITNSKISNYNNTTIPINNPNTRNTLPSSYYQIQKRSFEQADLPSNKIGAVYEYDDSVNRSAMKRAKFY